MPLAELRSAKVYYETTGSGPVVVFAHGAGGNALSWWQQVAFFSARYRCLTFDHPGFRHSAWNRPESDDALDYGLVLKELLDHLEIDNAAFVAQSMGGWTCLRFAVDYPARTSALVMAATDAGLYLPRKDRYTKQLDQLKEIRQAWERDTPGSFHPAAGSRMLAEQPELHDMYVEISRQNNGVSRRNWGTIETAELAMVRCPVLFVAGEEDIVCDPGRIEAAHRAVVGSELLTLTKSGHSTYFERAESFNVEVDRFFGSHFPADGDGKTIMQTFAR